MTMSEILFLVGLSRYSQNLDLLVPFFDSPSLELENIEKVTNAICRLEFSDLLAVTSVLISNYVLASEKFLFLIYKNQVIIPVVVGYLQAELKNFFS